MLDKLRVAAHAVIDHDMIVVAHRAWQQHFDLATQRGMDEAVQDRVVGRRVGAQQKLALHAAAGDQVELSRKHLARTHERASFQDPGQVIATRSRVVDGTPVAGGPATMSESRTPPANVHDR